MSLLRLLTLAVPLAACSVAEVDQVIAEVDAAGAAVEAEVDAAAREVIQEVDAAGAAVEAELHRAPAPSLPGRFAMFAGPAQGYEWRIEKDSRCLLVSHTRDLGVIAHSARELAARYGAVAETHGWRLVDEGVDSGQPYRRYRKGMKKLRIQVGWGRGNATVEIC